jgi:exonuclease VII small subunit
MGGLEMKDILSLTKKEIENLSFNQQLEYLERINDLFQNDNGDMDVESALELYKKSLDILSKAKGKLNLLKEEKEKIDKEYEKLFDNEKIEE